RGTGDADYQVLQPGVPQADHGSRVSFADRDAANRGGSFSYRVVAVRRGAHPEDTSRAISSTPSSARSVSLPTPTSQPGATPTTAVDGGSAAPVDPALTSGG